MTVYSIKIPFKSESDTAQLRAVIEADLAACETIEVHDDGKDIVGYFVRQEEWETDVILVTSETEKYLTVEVGAPCDRKQSQNMCRRSSARSFGKSHFPFVRSI